LRHSLSRGKVSLLFWYVPELFFVKLSTISQKDSYEIDHRRAKFMMSEGLLHGIQVSFGFREDEKKKAPRRYKITLEL
jgi:hypothetical protein